MFDNVDWGATIITLIVAFIGSGVISTLILKKHEREITTLKSKLESNTFITNKQFENELQIYREIWECISSVYVLMESDQKYSEKIEFDLIWLNSQFEKKYDDTFQLFANTFGKYEPFLEDSLCKDILELKSKFSKYAEILDAAIWETNEYNDISNIKQDIDDYPTVLNKEFIGLKVKVREYLRSLKVSE